MKFQPKKSLTINPPNKQTNPKITVAAMLNKKFLFAFQPLKLIFPKKKAMIIKPILFKNSNAIGISEKKSAILPEKN